METRERRWWAWLELSALAVALLVGCREGSTDPPQPTRSQGESLDTWWSSRTQAQRNQAIVDRALQQLGQVTGLQCKEWVRVVVSDASQGEVTIPPNRTNGWQWHSHPRVRLVAQNVCPANLQPGHILQVRQTSGLPHTAIVRSVGYDGMVWVDANWVNYNSPAGTVASHAVSWATFYRIASQYSFYEITG